MATVLDSFLYSLGFQVDTKALDGFAALAEKGKMSLVALGAAASGVAVGLIGVVKGASERMAQTKDFAAMMQMSSREVAALTKVAVENDSSVGGMMGTIQGLVKITGQAASGFPRAEKMFARFGLKAKNASGEVKSFDEIMADVIEKSEELGAGGGLALAGAFGIDPELLPLMRKGVKNFEVLRDEALNSNPFTQADYELADSVDEEFKKAGSSITKLKNILAVGVMPVVNDLLVKFTKWMKNEDNVKRLREAFSKVAESVAFVAKHIKVLGALIGVVVAHKAGAYFLDLGVNIMKAAAAGGKFTAALEILKNLLVGALASAFFLVAEDLWTFYTGGISVTGWMVNKFPAAIDGMKVALDVLGAAFLAISLGSGPVGVFAFAIGGIVIAALAVKDAWHPLMQWFGEQWDALGNKVRLFAKVVLWPIWAVSKLTGTTEKIFGKDTGPTGTAKTREALAEYTEEDFNARMAGFRQRNVQGGGVLDVLPNGQMPGNMMSWGRGDVTNTTTVGSIVIQGVQDPKANADAVDAALKKREAQTARSKGVERSKARNARGAE